ncbi:Mg2 transporter protein, corA-like/zinc transport protein ZntB [Physcia stellaris]|nr:Mg2 transporter protein, corA-like/zinc transport protein ZntB [Physcia stellaris]
MQGSTFQQISSPTNSTIDESPISPREEYDPRTVTAIQMQAETAPERTGSPYGFPPPQQVHPAYFAPFSEESNTQGHLHTQPADVPPSTAPAPPQTYEDVKAPGGNLEPQASSDRKTNALSQPVFSPPPRQATQIYDPDSLGGPNRTLENHRPGQVAHPNSALDPEWKHGLCDPDATCCLSLFCPCIIYGKTQYRLSRRAQKQDPTDMLGYEAFNGSCGIMAVAGPGGHPTNKGPEDV